MILFVHLTIFCYKQNTPWPLVVRRRGKRFAGRVGEVAEAHRAQINISPVIKKCPRVEQTMEDTSFQLDLVIPSDDTLLVCTSTITLTIFPLSYPCNDNPEDSHKL